MEESLRLIDILTILKKRILFIVSLIAICAGISAVISYFVLPNIYEAQTQILVNQKNTNQEEYGWSQLETDLQLIDTYNVIIKSPVILDKVIENLGLQTSQEELSQKIFVSNEDNSKVVNIMVHNQDLRQAVNIANTVAVVFKEEIPNLMNVDNISILSVAKMTANPSPVKPNKMLNITIAVVVGSMLGIGLAFLLEFLDRTIKTEKDIETILQLPMLGVVSTIAEKNQIVKKGERDVFEKEKT